MCKQEASWLKILAGGDARVLLAWKKPAEGDPPGAQWYYFEEFDSGNWMLNLGISTPVEADWHLLKN